MVFCTIWSIKIILITFFARMAVHFGTKSSFLGEGPFHPIMRPFHLTGGAKGPLSINSTKSNYLKIYSGYASNLLDRENRCKDCHFSNQNLDHRTFQHEVMSF